MIQSSQPSLMKLTKDNYYDHVTDWQYMSATIFKSFMQCEGATLAKIKSDKLVDETATPLLVGNYVHSYFESAKAHEAFRKAHAKEMLTQKGALRSEYKTADAMIGRLEADDFFNFVYQGEKESIVSGELFGVEWKGKIDCLNLEKGYFVDLKTAADLHKHVWSDRFGGYVSFILAYGYVLQMYVYKELLQQMYHKPFTPYIFAVSKQSPPDIAAVKIDDARYSLEAEYIKKHLPRIMDVMNGEIEPHYCGECDYCRHNKQLHGFIEVDRLLN